MIINYLRGWHLMRVLRFAFGMYVLIEGSMQKHWLIAGLGALFVLMAVLNAGCCSTNTINRTRDNTPSDSNQNTEEVIYEEVR